MIHPLPGLIVIFDLPCGDMDVDFNVTSILRMLFCHDSMTVMANSETDFLTRVQTPLCPLLQDGPAGLPLVTTQLYRRWSSTGVPCMT